MDYKPKFLAENLGSVYSPPAVKRKDEPDDEAINAKRQQDHRQERDRELTRKLWSHTDTAAAPPESLEEMMATIGKTVK